jgi:hypothetical protein
MKLARTLALGAALGALVVGCGEKELNAAGSPGDGAGGESPTGGSGGTPAPQGGQPAPQGGDDGGQGGDAPPVEAAPLTPYPDGCANDGDCTGQGLCRLGICVSPVATAGEAGYSCSDEPQPGARPSLGCWDTPAPLAQGPAEVPMRGLVEFFGDGEKPVDIRIRLYDFETFDPSACATLVENAEDLFEARRAMRDCIDELPFIDETTSVDCPDADAETACYSFDAVPTGRALVARLTGELFTWSPTFHYGLFINPCDNGKPRRDTGICPEELAQGDELATTNWECDLQADGGAQIHWRNLTLISQATWVSFPPTAGVARLEMGKAALAGRQFDCEGRSVLNAWAELADPGTQVYFNGDPADILPQPGRLQTNIRGTYAHLNVPPGPNGMTSAAQQDGAVKVVAYQRFFSLPNAVIMINLEGRDAAASEPPY